MAAEMASMHEALCDMTDENDALKAELSEVKRVKDRQEVKASRKDTEERLVQAAKQTKVMDMDFGSCITDRKQLLDCAKTKLREQVRSDLRQSYDDKMARAALAVIAKAPQKRLVNGTEIWTAPILLTASDKNDRYEIDNILRQSKLFPTYHWPKELMETVQEYRKATISSGVNPETNHIRIRPEERDGRWTIKADVKGKTDNSKFSTKFRWNPPPLDQQVRNMDKDWLNPVWTKSGRRPSFRDIPAPPPAGNTAANGASTDNVL